MKEIIEAAYAGERDLSEAVVIEAVRASIEALDRGELRVCERKENQWVVQDWLKKAILLYFRSQEMQSIDCGDIQYWDKIPLKKWGPQQGVRVVPHALARRGAFIEAGAILMPSYVNIGAYVGAGTMVDTWATVGSCAQIGRNVHLSGGVGIGGVLEPVQAQPVIIEDDVFVGSRCIIVEGALIESGAVIGAGVSITASSHIIDVTGSEEKVYKGRVPKNAVVIPGMRHKKFAAGEYGVSCALIVGTRTEATDRKTSLTEALREFSVQV